MNYLVWLLLFTQFNKTWDSRTVMDGPHVMTVEVTAADGLKTIKEMTFIVDNTKPAIVIGGIIEGGFYGGKTEIRVQAVDATSGVSRIELFINGSMVRTSNGSAIIYSWNTNPHKRTSPIIYTTAMDKAGNLQTRSIQVTVR